MQNKSDFIIGGMIQNQLVFALDLGYANQVVNIESHEMIPVIEIYPNPVKDVLNLKISSQDQEFSCRILNQTGQIIQDHKLNVNISSNISFISLKFCEFSASSSLLIRFFCFISCDDKLHP